MGTILDQAVPSGQITRLLLPTLHTVLDQCEKGVPRAPAVFGVQHRSSVYVEMSSSMICAESEIFKDLFLVQDVDRRDNGSLTEVGDVDLLSFEGRSLSKKKKKRKKEKEPPAGSRDDGLLSGAVPSSSPPLCDSKCCW